MKVGTSALGLASLLYQFVDAVDITLGTSARVPKTSEQLGSLSSLTTIKAGVYYWLSGRATHNFYGNIDNSGAILVSQTDSTIAIYGGQTCDWTGTDSSNGNLINRAGASISLNDVSAASAPTYDWSLNSMQNDGTIQFCGRGDTGGSTYQLYCRGNCVNNGLIDFTQVLGNLGTAAVWRNPVLSPGTKAPTQSITHNGGFLMRSMRVDFVQNFQGTGCWMIGNNAVMYLQDGSGYYQNAGYGPTLAGQSISFLDNTGVLHLDTKAYSLNSAFGAQVYGFGQGNGIEFYETIKSVSYTGSLLTISLVSGNTASIKIGNGYDASLFSIAKRRSNYAYYNTVYYSGAAPLSSPPAQCFLTTPVCQALTGPPVFSSSVVPTTTAFSPATTSVIPVTTTSSTSALSSSTSNFSSSTSTTVPTSTSIASKSSTLSSSVSSASTSLAAAPTSSTTSSSSSSSSTSTTSTSQQTKSLSTSSSAQPTSTLSTSQSVSSSSSYVLPTTSTTLSTLTTSCLSTIYTTVSFSTVSPVSSTTLISSSSSSTSSNLPTATEIANFYLKSSCDKSCLGTFGGDFQTYSNAMTSTSENYVSFFMSGDQLHMTSNQNLCVASQSGGWHSRLQCSNDPDYIDGNAIYGGFAFKDNALTYQSISDWAGCGVLDLANNYEPNGLTYSAQGVTADNCRACFLTKVYDIAQCQYTKASMS